MSEKALQIESREDKRKKERQDCRPFFRQSGESMIKGGNNVSESFRDGI